MLRHNNNDGLFSAAWSMTLVCTCPGFYHFLMDGPRIITQILPSSHPQLPLLYPSAAPFLSIPQSHSPSSISFVHPYSFSFPPGFSSIALYALSVTPSQWLCGFLHLCYVMALRGRGHFNQYFKQLGPGGLAPNANMRGWHLKKEGKDGPKIPTATSGAQT